MDGDIDEALYKQDAYRQTGTLIKTPYLGMHLETFRDPDANLGGFNDQAKPSYLELYLRLANWEINHNNLPEARRALDTLNARMPPKLVDWDYQILHIIGQLYQVAGDTAKSLQYTKLAAQNMSASMGSEGMIGSDQYLQNGVPERHALFRCGNV